MAVDPTIAPPQHRFSIADGKHSLVLDLPMLQTLAELELDIGRTEIRLALPGGHTTMIPLPVEIAGSSEAIPAVAKFSRKRGQLTISWCQQDFCAKAAERSAELEAPRGASFQDTIAESTASSPPEMTTETVEPNSDQAENDSEQFTFVTAASCSQERTDIDYGGALPTSAAPKAGPAYGSLWNANSWHWEEKNCMPMLCREVQHALEQCMSEPLKHIHKLNGSSVVLSAITVDGEASFTLRKGKRWLGYEISVSFNWDIRDGYGSNLGAKGKGQIVELTQDEDAPNVIVEVSATFSGGSDAKAGSEWMKRHGGKEIGKFLTGARLTASMVAAEEARANADVDASKRVEERTKADAAQEATVDERTRLAAEQRLLEEQRRVKPVEGAVQGSVWNANAWHWEEKPRTAWACAWLQSKLDGLTLNLFGGLAAAALSDVKVTGDASVSVRKGRPIALFQLSVECKWAITATAAGVGEAHGTLLVPEFTSEDGAKGSQIEVQAGGNKKTSGQLVAALKRDGVPLVRSVLAQFAEELVGQLDRSE